ncbi:radical SAM protein, partial [Brachyspira aalborgi]|uniref:radical SAM protein n=1 Tax=Brachyspira aalborgi TaxID=29522 RepID=UPI00266CA374
MNKKIIDNIAWWIPIRKWRDNFRNYMHSKIDIPTLPNLVFITNQKCNLKCKNCANFSPYLSQIIPYYKANELINDLKAITKHMNIWQLQLQGGEFFIHPEQYKILQYISRNKKIKNIMIATNGMIIPHKRILDLIKDNKNIYIRISNYGDINNTQSLKLKEKLDKYGIKNFMHLFANGDSYWSYCGDVNMERLSYKEMMNSYNNCIFAKVCLTLENGFVSICSRATIAHVVQNFEFSDKCGIYIRDNFNPSKFLKFAEEKPPVEACYYCYGTQGKQILPAEQVNKEEWEEVLLFVDKIRAEQSR